MIGFLSAPFHTTLALGPDDYALQDTPSKPAKGKRGNKKGKRGREPTIVIVFFHGTTFDGESSQKLNKVGKTFSSRCGVYLAISRKDKSIKQKTKAGESDEKDKTFFAMWKKTNVFSKSSPLLNTLLLVLRCLAGCVVVVLLVECWTSKSIH
jgi:hypothetical protein